MKDEKNLIQRLKLSDRQVFHVIFDLYAKKIYYFSFDYLKSKEDAEEIVQEAFIRLWEKRETLKEEYSLSGFLFTITYRLIMDYFRKRKTISEAQKQLFHVLTDESYQTEEELLYQELEALYQQAIDQLPPRRKEIFILSRKEGLTYQEIAAQLQISPKTVEHQLSESLHFMREYFKHYTCSFVMLFLAWLCF
ncbi:MULTISPECIES: RNA polymerase sigma-70 factor [Xanthocytophaga]|uniref:RNA polymerase sigma-70 factor n=2 Tax=Xanthocytophaga TaxID=3078918 RepID=A0AAE3U6K6_9BACT|nr:MULTISPECIES: RNA polymerase sigma-70 factor [Xanthocytophaga]MDJ1480677.1 RNA polymerase sigma-70 factor [Xanthocytophaga flavus]MDJ1506394.1 RNA polymerase sigma-70 factor [Xanthocytophaga agilis]